MRGLWVLAVIAGCSTSSSPPPVTEMSCGMQISSHVGDQIAVSLSSTYWSFDPVSNPAVLEQNGMTVITPSGNCVPGSGCGTAKAVFDAIGAGQATINASRSSCGEAAGCGPGQGQGICTITVDVARD